MTDKYAAERAADKRRADMCWAPESRSPDPQPAASEIALELTEMYVRITAAREALTAMYRMVKVLDWERRANGLGPDTCLMIGQSLGTVDGTLALILRDLEKARAAEKSVFAPRGPIQEGPLAGQ